MNTTFDTLGFTEIKDMLAQRAISPQAREILLALRPFYSESELRRNMRETTQARQMLDLVGQPPSPVMERTEQCLEKAVRGEMLLPEEVEGIGMFLTAVSRMRSYLERGKTSGIALAYYTENLHPLEELREEIGRTVRSGQVDSFATPCLSRLRRELEALEEKIKEKAEGLLRVKKS